MLNVPDHIWLLISRKLAGEATEKDLRELESYTRENPDMQHILEQAISFWNSGMLPIQSPDSETAFSNHMERMKKLAKEPEPAKPIWRKKENIKETLYAYFNMGIFRNYFKVIFRNLYRFRDRYGQRHPDFITHTE